MPHYTANINAYGWFGFTADDDEDAANVAAELTKGGVPIGAEFFECDVESVEADDDAD